MMQQLLVGNVETTQRIVDVMLKTFQAAAGSQGIILLLGPMTPPRVYRLDITKQSAVVLVLALHGMVNQWSNVILQTQE